MARIFLSLSLTKTAFSPPSMHFLEQAAWSAMVPLALAHLLSVTQPLILLSFASDMEARNATASRVNAIFFIICFLLCWFFRLGAAKAERNQLAGRYGSPFPSRIKPRKLYMNQPLGCKLEKGQTLVCNRLSVYFLGVGDCALMLGRV